MSIVEQEEAKALYEVKEFLISIMANAPYGVLAFDLEGEVIMTNSLAIEYLGNKMSVNKAIGLHILELVKDIPVLAKTVETCLKKGRKPFDLPPIQIKQKIILLKGRAILIGSILVIEDITIQKKAEAKMAEQTEELNQANLHLKDLDQLKSMFIASMSHELRTPLNSIIGFTGLILQGISGTIDQEAKEDLQIVFNSSKQLLGLINDVIDISKIESGRFESYFEEIRLDEVLKNAVTAVSMVAEEKKIAIKIDSPEELSIISDKKRLLQCVLNLMSNAVKFTEKGTIELKAVQELDTLKISVRDTGIGIKKENIPQLFTSFVRIDSPLKETTEGTGLGLYLTKKIMTDVFNGKVRVESEYEKGSTFTLILPLAKEVP
jgi:signal transduction histidine kinase